MRRGRRRCHGRRQCFCDQRELKDRSDAAGSRRQRQRLRDRPAPENVPWGQSSWLRDARQVGSASESGGLPAERRDRLPDLINRGVAPRVAPVAAPRRFAWPRRARPASLPEAPMASDGGKQ